MLLYIIGSNGSKEFNGECHFAPYNEVSSKSEASATESNGGSLNLNVSKALNGQHCCENDSVSVFAYCRDGQLLNRSRAEQWILKGSTEKESQHLNGLGKYLSARKKAAVARCDRTGFEFAILPAAETQQQQLLLCTHLGDVAAAAVQRIALPPPSSATVKTASAPAVSSAPTSVVRTAITATETAGGGGVSKVSQANLQQQPSQQQQSTTSISNSAVTSKKSSLLASLSSRMQASNRIAAEAQQSKQLAQTSKQSLLESIDSQVRAAVQQLSSNSSCCEVHLPPMSKDERAIVHNLLEQYEEKLIWCSSGDLEERHIVIYRDGCEPEEVKISVYQRQLKAGGLQGGRVKAANHSNSSSSATGLAVLPAAASSFNAVTSAASSAAAELIKVDQVKRDRRTLEEVQRDMKKQRTV